jgi:Rrf2 family transcriptional regulator, iron-sulfur cluster assembly transcription factor
MRQGKGPVTLSGISQRQAISLSYLEQLFGKLRRHEIVESIRGPGGGYSLARRADKVTVADIIIAVDEPLDATQCGGKENCHGANKATGARCMTHELWATLNEKMARFRVPAGPGRPAETEKRRAERRGDAPQRSRPRLNRSSR